MTTPELIKHLLGETGEQNYVNKERVIIVEGQVFQNVSLYEEITYPYEIEFRNCQIADSFYVLAGKFERRFIIKNCKAKNVVINGGDFAGDLFISSNEISGGIVIAKQDEYIWMSSNVSIEGNSGDYIAVVNLDMKYLAFHNNKVDRINLMNSLMTIDENRRPQTRLSGYIKSLRFVLEPRSRFYISNQNIDDISFNGSLDDAEVILDTVTVGKISFEDFIKASGSVVNFLRFKPRDKNSSFLMRNSLMGDSSFNDCDFKSFSSFKIANSQLSKIQYAHTTWPDKISIASPDQLFPNQSYGQYNEFQLREIYRQLKLSAISQSDKFMEAFFYRNEMVYLHKTLSPKTHLGSKIVLLLSRYSNNHKQNWILPIVLFFGVNFVCAVMIGSTSLSHLRIDWNIFFNLLNPAHRFSDLNVNSLFGTLFVDFISRVLTGFLIYQTIAAFRKLS